MSLLQTFITVKEDVQLERAIAQDMSEVNDADIPESFLDEMSTQYPHTPGKKTTVVENMDEQGD